MGAQIDIMTGGATMGLGAATGATIGSIAGYVTGKKNIDRFNSEKRQKDSLLNLERQRVITQASQYNQLDATNRGYSAQGSNMSSFYGKNGGVVYKQGGSLNPISSDTKLAVGRSHEDGGIRMSDDAEIEGGETVVDKGDHTLVVSDNLVNPKTGRTFAKDDLRLAKLARKYEGVSTQLAKNSLKHVQAKREELHNLQQQMNGDASDMDTAQNGGKMKPVNILTKPIKTAVPSRPKPMLAQNGGKLRPINILTKPVKTSSRPATHFAKDGMKLYGDGGKAKKQADNYAAFKKNNYSFTDPYGKVHEYYTDSKTGRMSGSMGGGNDREFTDDEARQVDDTHFGGRLYSANEGNVTPTPKGGRMYKGGSGKLYNINAKGERFVKTPGGQFTKTDKFPDSVEKQFGWTSVVPPAKIDPSKVDNTPAPSTASLAGNPMTGDTIGKRVSDNSPVGGTMEGYNKTPNKVVQPSTLKGESVGNGLRKAWDKTKAIGESALPGLSRAGKLASYAAPGLAQYYANKADIARQKGMKIPDAPQQGFQSLAKQNMEVDRAAIRKQQADYNAGVAGTLADSQTAALLKANMASKAGDALVKINQDERNANIETANRQTQLNLGIDAANKNAKYQQAGLELEKNIDLSRRRARNVAELSANMQQVQDVDRREKWADADTLVKVAGLDERGINYLDRIGANPAGHYTGRKLISRNGGKLTKLRR